MNALHERYASVKTLIHQKNEELRHLYNTKVQLKQQILLQELQELPYNYKENIHEKLWRLKVFIEHSSIYRANYAFVFNEQPVDQKNIPIRDQLNWQIVEYTMENKRYMEIAIGVSKVCISVYVREWLAKNVPSLEHSSHLHTMSVIGSEEYN